LRFELHEDTIRAIPDDAGRLAASIDLPTTPGAELSIAEMAALYYSRHGAESLRAPAIARRGSRAYELETFSPLYLTNTCDSECKMCGMRRDNRELERETANPVGVQHQLEILARRGVLAVGLLTGEYRRDTRHWSIALTRDAL